MLADRRTLNTHLVVRMLIRKTQHEIPETNHEHTQRTKRKKMYDLIGNNKNPAFWTGQSFSGTLTYRCSGFDIKCNYMLHVLMIYYFLHHYHTSEDVNATNVNLAIKALKLRTLSAFLCRTDQQFWSRNPMTIRSQYSNPLRYLEAHLVDYRILFMQIFWTAQRDAFSRSASSLSSLAYSHTCGLQKCCDVSIPISDNDWFTKPFSATTLRAEVRNVFDDRSGKLCHSHPKCTCPFLRTKISFIHTLTVLAVKIVLAIE